MEIPLNEFADIEATWSAVFTADVPCVESFWKVGHLAACCAACLQAFQKNPYRTVMIASIRIGKHIPTMMIHNANGISARVVPLARREYLNLMHEVWNTVLPGA